MPYIKADDGRREALRKGEPALSAGELNYQIFYYVKHNSVSDFYVGGNLIVTNLMLPTELICDDIRVYVSQFLGAKPNYQKWNDVTGALVRCARELNRRLNLNAVFLTDLMNGYDERINAYEDEKIKENGDVE